MKSVSVSSTDTDELETKSAVFMDVLNGDLDARGGACLGELDLVHEPSGEARRPSRTLKLCRRCTAVRDGAGCSVLGNSVSV